ncbi:MAG: hypothetical protein JW861_12100 [Bacteroidales bacterium]|nr:hypothetical protein [Bacteroidales bacterium]
MEKKSKVATVYGYAVCLVAVITFIISIAALVNALIDLGDPLHAEREYGNAPSLASFENYKMDILKSPDKEASFIPDDETLRAMYEAARDEKILSVKHRTIRTTYANSILIVICVVLFITHWRWMRRLGRIESESQ